MSARGALALGLALWAVSGSAGPPGPEPAGTGEPGLAEEGFVTADRQVREAGRWVGEGLVDIRWRGVVIQADRAELDEEGRRVVAEGNVVLQEGDRRITGERLEFDLERRTGKLWKVWGYSGEEVYFTADEIEKQSDDRYALSGPTVTSCNQPNPIWRLKAASGTLVRDRWVRLWSVRLEIKGVPVLWLPFFQYPARRERATGFLFPSFGKNSNFGFYVANSFFWALSRSYDLTVTHEWYKDRGSLVRGEFLYVPAEGATGRITSENFFDTRDSRTSGRYQLYHNQSFGRGWRVGADLRYATDERLDREFSNSIGRISQRSRLSEAFLARNWSHWNLGLAARHQIVLGSVETTDDYLPAAELTSRSARLAGPLFASGGLRAANFGRSQGDDDLRWQRLDFDPTLTLPLSPAPWLQLKPQATYRLTWYSKSYEPGSNRLVVLDEDFLRRYFRAGVQLTGPVFTRVFHTPGNGYSERFKHVIEPSVAWDYTSDFDPGGRALSVDAIDRLPRQNQVTVALRNRFLAKRPSWPGGPEGPYEFLTAGLTMSYSLDPKLGTALDGRNLLGLLPGYRARREGPLVADLRFAPVAAFLLTYRASYDTVDRFFAQQSLQATTRGDTWHLDASFSRGRSAERVHSQFLRGSAGFGLLGGRVQLGGSASYDLGDRRLLEAGATTTLHTQCCGIGFGWNRRHIGVLDDSQFRFSLSLKNVGTVFDYTLGDDRL